MTDVEPPPRRPGATRSRRPVRAVAHALSRRAARRYTAGPAVEDAILVARRTIAEGATVTIGAWTEPDMLGDEATAAHLDAIGAIRDARIDAVLAVKCSALEHQPALIDAVVDAASEAEIELCFDAHGPEVASPTLAAAARAAAIGHPSVGVALPGRWTRSPGDALLARERQWAVRLIKGQWPDVGGLEIDPARGMMRVAEQLLGYSRTVRIATHDAPVLESVAGRLTDSSTPVEVELLLGMPLASAARTARRLRLPVRLYVPFGAADVPYELRAACHDPSVALRLARDAAIGRHWPR